MSKKKYIETPELLYELFDKYKSKIHENPRYQYQLDKTGKVVPVPLRVPLTMEGFNVFCYNEIGFVEQYFENRDSRYSEYVGICSHIKKEIRQDQIEGGMVGQYNASITQRLNNLIDKQQHEVKMEQPLFPDID
jgi:hypothetical protein